jgi:autotransporter-associated beta strand protein
VASGAILFASGNAIGIAGGTLDFGAREGIVPINSSGNTTIGSVITGSAGVSYYGTGTLVLGARQSTYSGDTRLQVGIVIPQASSVGPAERPRAARLARGR